MLDTSRGQPAIHIINITTITTIIITTTTTTTIIIITIITTIKHGDLPQLQQGQGVNRLPWPLGSYASVCVSWASMCVSWASTCVSWAST